MAQHTYLSEVTGGNRRGDLIEVNKGSGGLLAVSKEVKSVEETGECPLQQGIRPFEISDV